MATTTNTAPATSGIPTRKGRILGPRRRLISGPPGIGKSTLIGNCPGLILLDCEGGADEIDVERFLFRDADYGHIPRSLDEVMTALRRLAKEPHAYTAVGIDTLDRLEALAIRHIMERDKMLSDKGPMVSVESYGYGKGWNYLLDQMREVFTLLDALRLSRNMDIWITAHVQVVKRPNPAGSEWDQFVLKASKSVSAYAQEWCDDVAFLHWTDVAGDVAGIKSSRPKGITTGLRVLEFGHSAAWEAPKARSALPPRIEIPQGNPWEPLGRAIDIARNPKPADLARLIECELARLAGLGPDGKAPTDAEWAARVRPYVEKVLAGPEAKKVPQLTVVLQDLRNRETPPPTAADQTTTAAA